MSENKTLFRKLIFIGVPITLQCILQSLLPIIDEIMIGQIDESYAIASITAGNRIYNIFNFAVLALVGAASIYVTQFWGNNKKDSIPKAFKIPFALGFLCLAVYLAITFFFPTQSINLFTSDPEVIKHGAEVQKFYALSAIPVLFTNIFATLLRSTNQVKAPMFCGIFSVVSNTVLNYIFIFGFYAIPPMTIRGAALATFIARTLEALLLAGYIYLINRSYKFNLFKIFTHKIDKDFKKAYYKSMLPLLTLNILFIVADTVYSAIYGHMGTNTLNAASIMFPIQNFSVGLFSGLASATAIILGHELGKNNFDTAISYSKKILKVTTLLSIVISVLLAFAAIPYVSLYKVDNEVANSATLLIFAAAVYLTVKVVNMVACQGIIQCGGDTKFILFLDIIGPWCIGIPLAFISGCLLNLPIYIVFSLLSLEEVVRLILALKKISKHEWAANIVSELKV